MTPSAANATAAIRSLARSLNSTTNRTSTQSGSLAGTVGLIGIYAAAVSSNATTMGLLVRA